METKKRKKKKAFVETDDMQSKKSIERMIT